MGNALRSAFIGNAQRSVGFPASAWRNKRNRPSRDQSTGLLKPGVAISTSDGPRPAIDLIRISVSGPLLAVNAICSPSADHIGYDARSSNVNRLNSPFLLRSQ